MADRLFPLVYDELRRIARRQLRRERQGHTLSTTALVHEAYLRLVDQTRLFSTDRVHFYAIAARAMRRISSTTPVSVTRRSVGESRRCFRSMRSAWEPKSGQR